VRSWEASANPALSVKPPKSNSSPTLPFEEEAIQRMLAAADTFTVKGNFGANRKRVRAMILLLRYLGLRISDASTLERSRVRPVLVGVQPRRYAATLRARA
jgi:hypothetical protein